MERMPKYYGDSGSDFKLMTHLYDDATTMLESIERGQRLNGLFVNLDYLNLHFQDNFYAYFTGKGNCLGRIDQVAKTVLWTSYDTVLERIQNFGDGLNYLLDGPHLKSRKEYACVGIYSANCPDYVIAEYGCYWHTVRPTHTHTLQKKVAFN